MYSTNEYGNFKNQYSFRTQLKGFFGEITSAYTKKTRDTSKPRVFKKRRVKGA